MLTDYARARIRFLLAASRIWITQYEPLAAPCDLCPPNRRITSNTTIIGTHLNIQMVLRICYKCIARAHLRREREYHKTQRALYMPRTAKRERAASVPSK